MAFFDNFSKKVQDVAFVATEKAQQVAAVAGENAGDFALYSQKNADDKRQKKEYGENHQKKYPGKK